MSRRVMRPRVLGEFSHLLAMAGETTIVIRLKADLTTMGQLTLITTVECEA